jgi:hypothetical protein
MLRISMASSLATIWRAFTSVAVTSAPYALVSPPRLTGSLSAADPLQCPLIVYTDLDVSLCKAIALTVGRRRHTYDGSLA